MTRKVLFISHDANRAGSQLLLLQLLKHLKARQVPMHLLLAEGGVLESEFRKVTDITFVQSRKQNGRARNIFQKVIGNLTGNTARQQDNHDFQREIESLNPGLVFVNSIANAELYHNRLAFLHHVPMVLFAHELEMSANLYAPEEHLSFLLQKSSHLIAVSNAVTQY